MTKNEIINKLDNNFVNNYEDMIKYKNNLNDILLQMGFNKFKSYNEFCIYIRNNALEKLKERKNYNLDNTFFSVIMNKSLKDKIKKDKNYNRKLNIYFNDDNFKIK